MLHTNSVSRNRQADNRPEDSSSREEAAQVNNSMVNLHLVPVKVWLKRTGAPMITYAFLDSGSSSSFCTESLMKQLGVSGTRTKISLTTLEKKDSLLDSFVVKDLVISDLDENVFIELPLLYTRPEIPVSKVDIHAK